MGYHEYYVSLAKDMRLAFLERCLEFVGKPVSLATVMRTASYLILCRDSPSHPQQDNQRFTTLEEWMTVSFELGSDTNIQPEK